MSAAFIRHRRAVLPLVREELVGWRRTATSIPDPTLRRHALAALTDKVANVEATAVFAGLAPRRTRRGVIRASTSLQVAVDYLDSLGEGMEGLLSPDYELKPAEEAYEVAVG